MIRKQELSVLGRDLHTLLVELYELTSKILYSYKEFHNRVGGEGKSDLVLMF